MRFSKVRIPPREVTVEVVRSQKKEGHVPRGILFQFRPPTSNSRLPHFSFCNIFSLWTDGTHSLVRSVFPSVANQVSDRPRLHHSSGSNETIYWRRHCWFPLFRGGIYPGILKTENTALCVMRPAWRMSAILASPFPATACSHKQCVVCTLLSPSRPLSVCHTTRWHEKRSFR